MTTIKTVGITGANPIIDGDVKAPFLATRTAYFDLIEGHGAAPIMLHNSTKKETWDTYANICDGLLLTGGGDIDPRYYQHEKHKLTGAYTMTLNEKRDEMELYLVKKFFELKKPILGICRGSQLINIAFGGTLIQDIQTALPQITENHINMHEKGLWYVTVHTVKALPDTHLSATIGENYFPVNSVHHQMIDTPGKNLHVAAASPQGVVEAIEYVQDDRFVLGVQWHPEQLAKTQQTKQIVESFYSAMSK